LSICHILSLIAHNTQATKGKVPTGHAFEDVLYGSESELDDSDDDEQPSRPMAGPKRKGVEQGVRLRVDDDEPMDLLQGAALRLTSGFFFTHYHHRLFTSVQTPKQTDAANRVKMQVALKLIRTPERWSSMRTLILTSKSVLGRLPRMLLAVHIGRV